MNLFKLKGVNYPKKETIKNSSYIVLMEQNSMAGTWKICVKIDDPDNFSVPFGAVVNFPLEAIFVAKELT